MKQVVITPELEAKCEALEKLKAEIASDTGSNKPSDLSTEVIQLRYLKRKGFGTFTLPVNCGKAGIDATSDEEGQSPLQLKNTDSETSEYSGGKSSPMHKIAEKAVAVDLLARLVFTRMKNGEVVDCVIGPASALLGWRTKNGNGVQRANYNTLVKQFGFVRV